MPVGPPSAPVAKDHMEVVMAVGQEKQLGRVTTREARGCVIVGLNGACDSACADELGRTVDSLVDSGHTSIVLDLSRTRYVESAGFRLIVDRLSRLHELGGQLIVSGLQGTVGRAFKLLKLDRSVPVVDDVGSALQYVSTKERKAS